MARVTVIHWHEAEAAERAERLRALGHDVATAIPDPIALRELTRKPPDALVVDLSRLPSQGRDVAIVVRRSTTGREVPIVFVGGDPEKVARVRELLPDATYCTWRTIGTALNRALLASRTATPVVPTSALAGYASTPLPQKLGIRKDTVVAVVGAPTGFDDQLGSLPEGAVVRRGNRGKRDLTIVFVDTLAQVEPLWDSVAANAHVDDVWIVWPKKASPHYDGITQAIVRKLGMARGFVDYKVAAIDEEHAGLRFKRR